MDSIERGGLSKTMSNKKSQPGRISKGGTKISLSRKTRKRKVRPRKELTQRKSGLELIGSLKNNRKGLL